MSSGTVFQRRGPATGKARLPTVESLTGGTSRQLVPAERNVRRPGRSATGTTNAATKRLINAQVTMIHISV